VSVLRSNAFRNRGLTRLPYDDEHHTVSDFGSPSRRVLVCLLAGLGAVGCIVAGTANTMSVGIIGVVFGGLR
jgi:hypothetical protein